MIETKLETLTLNGNIIFMLMLFMWKENNYRKIKTNYNNKSNKIKRNYNNKSTKE